MAWCGRAAGFLGGMGGAQVDDLAVARILFAATLVELLIISIGAPCLLIGSPRFEHGEARKAHRRSERLEALRKAGLALTTELDIAKVLQQVWSTRAAF